MRLSQTYRACLFSACCAVLTLWLVGTSQSFQDCVKERKNHQGYEALHEESSLFVKSVVRLRLSVACGRHTLAENDAAITALATVILAWFTFALWRSTHLLWRAGERQFIASFPPKLWIRNFVFDQPARRNLGIEGNSLLWDIAALGQFYVENRGGTEATIVESHCVCRVIEGPHLPMKRPYESDEANNPVTPGTVIPPGASWQGLFSFMLTEDEEFILTSENASLYVMGWIAFADKAKFERRMAFCRVFDRQAHRFFRVGDADYSHGE